MTSSSSSYTISLYFYHYLTHPLRGVLIHVDLLLSLSYHRFSLRRFSFCIFFQFSHLDPNPSPVPQANDTGGFQLEYPLGCWTYVNAFLSLLAPRRPPPPHPPPDTLPCHLF